MTALCQGIPCTLARDRDNSVCNSGPDSTRPPGPATDSLPSWQWHEAAVAQRGCAARPPPARSSGGPRPRAVAKRPRRSRRRAGIRRCSCASPSSTSRKLCLLTKENDTMMIVPITVGGRMLDHRRNVVPRTTRVGPSRARESRVSAVPHPGSDGVERERPVLGVLDADVHVRRCPCRRGARSFRSRGSRVPAVSVSGCSVGSSSGAAAGPRRRSPRGKLRLDSEHEPWHNSTDRLGAILGGRGSLPALPERVPPGSPISRVTRTAELSSSAQLLGDDIRRCSRERRERHFAWTRWGFGEQGLTFRVSVTTRSSTRSTNAM